MEPLEEAAQARLAKRAAATRNESRHAGISALKHRLGDALMHRGSRLRLTTDLVIARRVGTR